MNIRNQRHRRRRWAFGLVLLLLVVAFCELAALILCGVLQEKWCMYSVPAVIEGNMSYEQYLEERDPVLGWPRSSEFGSDFYDHSGARPSPASSDSSRPSQISLYGDSFTRSRCTDAEAWGNLIAERMGVGVANYGVPGYGTDQAFLRFQMNGSDTSDVVILSHMTENIMRNLTRNRDLLTYQRHLAYKPRFVLSNGDLVHVPIPRLTREEHLRCIGVEEPLFELEYESFQPGGPAGIVAPGFPWTLSILRNLGSLRMQARLAGLPEYHVLYERGHPLAGFETTAGICRAFARLAKEREKTPIVFVLPGQQDLLVFQETGKWVYGDLVNDLREAGIPCFEFGTALLEHLGPRDPGELFDPTTHYLPEADALLAEFAREVLLELGLPR